MAGKGKKDDKKPPQMADLVEGFNAMAGIMQKQGKAIQGIMGVLGLSDNGSEGAAEVLVEGTEQGRTSDGKYPYGYGKDQAKIELTNLAFNTQSSKLPELTETPRGQVQPTAALEAYNIYIGNMERMAALRAAGRDAEADTIYEPMESIFIRCRDRRMLSVQRRSRMEILEFNKVQQEREQVEEGQELGF